MENNDKKVYLRIGEDVFGSGNEIEGVEYDWTPSMVLPSMEIIKNAERSLDGSMNVDIIKSKKKIEVMFPLLTTEALKVIMDKFNNDELKPHEVQCYGEPAIDCYVESIDYLPFMTASEDIMWKDVTITFIEL